jgi:membrane associated rhomboid family serine protease
MRLSGRKQSSVARQWTHPQRAVLVSLIALNVAAFVAQLIVEGYQPGIVRDYLGLSETGVQNAYGWQFVTAAFLHAGPWHLLGNTIVLYLLGRDVDSVIGQRQFFFLYVVGAVAGELGHLATMPANTVLLGASGGVAAVLMAYATILPELELTSMVFFVVPLRLKAKHLAYGAVAVATILVFIDRAGTVSHSAWLGGCAAGWVFAHLLGFGRPSFVQRALHQRKAKAERYQHMDAEQFIAEEVDPLLDKIARDGLQSLTRRERRILAQAREKLVEQA